ncbi:BTB domain-containing protein [Mycena kentingensis (nom. inval.)]|nr:BTB domain-containing protein [Mycena kentingensis (nom. inval.)]
MSADAPPTKRRREEESDSDLPVTRSPAYWFEDGNIILQVESTQFRVTKSMLAMHSDVLRDMFLVPLPVNEPLVEGCHVVHLPGDTANDWTYLLEAMYPKICFERKVTPANLCAVLRLSHKYDCLAFRQECTRRLKAEYPATLKGYQKVMGQWTHMAPPKTSSGGHVQLVNTASELGLHSVLPSGFYQLTHSCLSESEDGGDIASQLAPADQIRFWKGCAFLSNLHAKSKTPERLCFGPKTSCIPCASCQTPVACTARRAELFDAALDSRLSARLFGGWKMSWSTNICAACTAAARTACEQAEEDSWNTLPSLFGLPSWEELLKMDSE